MVAFEIKILVFIKTLYVMFSPDFDGTIVAIGGDVRQDRGGRQS